MSSKQDHAAILPLTLMGQILEESLNEIFIFDAQTLKFIQVNRGARQNIGYSMQELLEMTPIDIKPEHTQDSFIETIAPLLNGDLPRLEFNSIHQRKNGSTYTAEVHLQKMTLNGQSVFVAIILDITERLKIRSELNQAQAFLESAPDAMVIVDNNGDINLANRQMTRLFGYTQDELLNLNVDQLVPVQFQDAHSVHRAAYDASPRVRGMGADLDLSGLTKDGREIPIEVSLSPIKTDDTSLVAAAIRDISARKEAEKALKTSQHKLQLAKEVAEQATSTKTRFLAAASHDLRQPLQALRLYLSALTNKLDDPKALQLSDKMHVSLDTMGELLEALLDISTLESGSVEAEKRDICLSEVLDRVVTDNTPQAAEKGLSFECAPTNLVVHSDPKLLERIIENFVSNAIRYTENGKVAIGVERDGDYAVVSVSDTGVGIPKDQLTNVFEEYYQLDNSVRDRRKGLGLGLSIVKHIARILEHDVDAASAAGEGATFSVILPIGDSQGVADQKAELVDVKKVTVAKPTVLMIDDDDTIMDAMCEVLDAYDVMVTTAQSGQLAIEKIKSGLRPDMVVSDYRMPGLDGVATVLEIRKLMRAEVPVVIMTGDAAVQRIKQESLANCTVLTKPVDMTQLISLLDSLRDD